MFPINLFNSIWQVVFYCTLGVQTALNVRHYRVQSISGAGSDVTNFQGALNSTWADAYKAWLGTDSTFYGLGVRMLLPTKTIEFFSSAAQGPGLAGVNDEGAQVAGCLTLNTGFAGRRFRGRIYPPFPGHDITLPPFGLTGGGVTALTNLGDAAMTTLPFGGLTDNVDMQPILMDNLKTVSRGAIISYRPNNKLATQRRRGAYGRPNPPPF